MQFIHWGSMWVPQRPNVVILKDGKEIVAKSLIDVGAGTSGPQRAIDAVLEAAGMTRDQMAYVLATGYGRNSLMGLADKQMSELSCHARGASFLFPEAHTVIDIGGQDVKVLRIENGTMTNFQMNDKCSAGTGRFFEVMSRVLDIDLTHLAEEALKSKKPCSISKQCSVFAESEVISLVNNSVPLPDIAAGIHESIARRIHGMAFKVGVEEDVALTGGCSSNKALRKALEKRLHLPLAELTMDPQLMGALGAALLLRNITKQRKLRLLKELNGDSL